MTLFCFATQLRSVVHMIQYIYIIFFNSVRKNGSVGFMKESYKSKGHCPPAVVLQNIQTGEVGKELKGIDLGEKIKTVD